MEAPPLVRVRGLSKVYVDGEKEVHALRGVDLDLHGGKIYGLLGPNGAGKTTLLRIFATLLAPSSGDVWIRDRHTVDDAAAVRALLGYLSANTGIYERLTPRELLRYFGRLHGLTRTVIEERTHTIFARLEIEEYSDRPAGQLSTGMKQKVSIARAFLHDPPVLILDEPTNGLDVLVRESLLELVRESARADRIIILSTHDLSEAEGLCDAFLFIDDGHLIAEGTREELLGTQARPLREVFFEALGRPVHAS